jgi:sulfur carrier protein ThiS
VLLRVKFSGVLPSVLNVSSAEMTVEATPGSTLRDVLRLLDVPEGTVMVYAVNGRIRPPDYQPQDGDEITAISSIAGG